MGSQGTSDNAAIDDAPNVPQDGDAEAIGQAMPVGGELAVQSHIGSGELAHASQHTRSADDIVVSWSNNSGPTIQTILSRGAFDMDLVQKFGQLHYYERLAVLRALYELDSAPEQRVVGVLTPLVSMTLATGLGLGAGFGAGLAGGLWAIVVGVGGVAIGSVVTILKVGKRESSFEKARAATVKVLEEVHKTTCALEEKKAA